jgi:hypothetical protein
MSILTEMPGPRWSDPPNRGSRRRPQKRPCQELGPFLFPSLEQASRASVKNEGCRWNGQPQIGFAAIQ